MLMVGDRILETVRPHRTSLTDRQRFGRATTWLREEQLDRFAATRARRDPRTRRRRWRRQVVHDAAGYL